jgi:hypothetical protein
MPWKYFEIPLSDGFFIVVDFTRYEGRIVVFVIRLMLQTGCESIDIARYDGAHGVPHLDQMGKSGRLQRKQWMPEFDFDEAVEYAIEDFKQNYERYYQDWLGN